MVSRLVSRLDSPSFEREKVTSPSCFYSIKYTLSSATLRSPTSLLVLAIFHSEVERVCSSSVASVQFCCCCINELVHEAGVRLLLFWCLIVRERGIRIKCIRGKIIRILMKMSWRRLEDVFRRRLQKTSWSRRICSP